MSQAISCDSKLRVEQIKHFLEDFTKNTTRNKSAISWPSHTHRI